MESGLNIAYDKVEKIPVPLLIVGLGGTGCDALLAIKQTFVERYVLPKNYKGQELPAPPMTAYLAIDSMSSKPDGLEASEFMPLLLTREWFEAIQHPMEKLTPYEKTWFNKQHRRTFYEWNDYLFTLTRQEARLALSRNFEAISQAVKSALNNILSVTADNVNNRVNQVEIVVVTGISGGTGSGIFLDICQILRAAAKAATVIPAKLTGYIVMPDVSLAHISSASGVCDLILQNSYAALKELDFWMCVRQHKIPYSMQYGTGVTIEWNQPPFDYCYLMSSTNVAGKPYKDGYSAVMSTIAESLLHFFSKDVNYSIYWHPFRDALGAVCIQKNYPLYYGYCAIGAFTKRIPKKKILHYEGALLLKTFIPLRDDSGKLQPDRRMFTDGQGKHRAEDVTGSGKQLMQDFRTSICKLPNFCYLDLNDRVKVTAVQNMNPPPHNKWHTWRDQVSAPAALTASENYLEKAWNRFITFANKVIMDPEQGPFALEAYLDAPDGMLSFMNEIYESWLNQYNKTHNQSIAQAEEMCNTSWPTFRNPPMLGKKGALEQYDHALKTLYTYVNNDQFLEKHTEALRKLILRVKEYLRDGLKPLCASILFLEKEFNTPEQDDAVLVQDIYDLSTVQKSIDDAFKEANAENRLSSEFLGKIAEISQQTQPNVDAKTSGVEFICRRAGLQEICTVLQSDLEAVYGSVNNQSLDDIMRSNVGDDVAAQQKWMDNLAKSALDSALPMFMQDAVFKTEDKALYSYMSIPKDAYEHLKYIQTAFKNHDPAVEPIASSLRDHIYTLMEWGQLPLYRYGLFEDLRIAYDQGLNRYDGYGVHLVQNGDPDADFLSDWSQLPSPKPYFLFMRNSVYSEEAQYERVHSLVERGIRCKMIKVQDDMPFVSATVNMFWSDDGLTLLASDKLLEKKKAIEAEKNPATGDTYSDSEIAAKLQAFLGSGKKTILEDNAIKPANIASVLGLAHQPCDPFNPQIKANLQMLKKAWENYKKLCVTMTEALIYMRPDIVRALELQLPAYEEIYDKIHDRIKRDELWEKRYNYAETAADILLYLNEIIFLGNDGYMYKERDSKYSIVNPAILEPDLKSVESELLKAIAFLADAPKDNATKADLTRLMNTAKRKFNDAINDENMTKVELEETISAATKLTEKLQKEQQALEHAIHENPGREDELKPLAEMAEKIRKILDARIRNYKKIAQVLD